MNAKDTIRVQTCELSAEDFTDFLNLYPVPSEYHVMLPKPNQAIFDAPDRLNPFGCAKLTTFIVMCKAYGCEPTVDLFRGFFNSFLGGKWLTFSKRPENTFPIFFPESLPTSKLYPTSVRVFPDPILFTAGLKPSWEHGQQRTVIIVGGQEMSFRNFMYAENDDDLYFLPNEPSTDFGTGSLSVSINTEPLVVEAVPIDQLAKNMADSMHSPH
ncbi:hypothetical protein Tco_0227486 [Tanacetum coccineum]